MSHTSGPWLYARVNDTTEAIVTNEGDSICDVRGASAADLSLISAAPALLAALQNMLMGDYHDCPAVRARRDHARAAIARATYTPEN